MCAHSTQYVARRAAHGAAEFMQGQGAMHIVCMGAVAEILRAPCVGRSTTDSVVWEGAHYVRTYSLFLRVYPVLKNRTY